MYKDGALVGTLSGITGNIDWGTHGQWNVLGHPQESLANNRLNGYVDDVRIANVARDQTYFQSLYASGTNTDSYSFAANTLPGLKVWYKADAITGASNGSSVTTWADSSGNGKNLTGTGATYVEIGPNGRPAVRLNNANMNVSNAGTPTGSSAITAYCVFVPNAPSLSQFWGIGDNSIGRLGLWKHTGNSIGFEGMGQSTAFTHQIPNGTLALISYPYATGTKMSANPVYYNGVASETNTSSGNLNIGSQNITLGHIPGYDGHYGNSDIAEILVYNTTHTTTERQQVEAYLATKYGITVAT